MNGLLSLCIWTSLFGLRQGEPSGLAAHRERLHCFAVNPSESLLATGGDKLILWDLQGLRAVSTHENIAKRSIRSVGFSRDGKLIAIGGEDGDLKALEVTSGRQVANLKGHWFDVSSLCFSVDGHTLVSSGEGDNTVICWDLKTESARFALRYGFAKGHPYRMYSEQVNDFKKFKSFCSIEEASRGIGPVLLMNCDTRFIAGTDASELKARSIRSGEVEWSVQTGHSEGALRVAFSSDERLLATGSGWGDGSVEIWELGAKKRRIQRIGAHSCFTEFISFCCHNQRILTLGGDDNSLRLWDIGSGKRVATLISHTHCGISAVAILPSANTAVVAIDNRVLFWKLDTGQVLFPVSRADEKLSRQAVEKLWENCHTSDREIMTSSIWKLASSPKAAFGFLKHRLRPVPKIDIALVSRHYRDLGSDDFGRRRNAQLRLEELGDGVVSVLLGMVKDGSRERHERVNAILRKLAEGRLSNESRAMSAAVNVLARTNDSECLMLLRAVAAGAPGAHLTEVAGKLAQAID